MKEMWDKRYSTDEYLYGISPNQYFKEELNKLAPGRLLLLGEGEGRNAVYAATQGWIVDAVDFSSIGKEKAENLAKDHGVEINYYVEDVTKFDTEERYDAVGVIYLHLPPEEREVVHSHAQLFLKKSGTVILEAFSKEQIKNESGGPPRLDMLFSLEELFSDFHNLDLTNFKQCNIFLSESQQHNGHASVIRLTGIK